MVRVMAVLIALVSVTSSAQAPADPLLVRLEGRWQGKGTVLSQPAEIDMEWAWTLDRQFLRLTFSNEMGTPPNARRFDGHAYYRALGNGAYRGTWFDNSGAIRPIEARAEGDAIVARWGTDDTEVGETTYRLTGPDRLEVVDRVRQKDGTWRAFGQSGLMKR